MLPHGAARAPAWVRKGCALICGEKESGSHRVKEGSQAMELRFAVGPRNPRAIWSPATWISSSRLEVLFIWGVPVLSNVADWLLFCENGISTVATPVEL